MNRNQVSIKKSLATTTVENFFCWLFRNVPRQNVAPIVMTTRVPKPHRIKINLFIMKKIILALFILSIAGMSCQKEKEVNSIQETKNAVKQTRKKRQRKDFIIVVDNPNQSSSEKGFCGGAGNNCGKASISTFSGEELEQLNLLNSYFLLNNANRYFDTPNWDMLFEEIKETNGLIDRIHNDEVLFFRIPSGESDGSTTYVLSTARNIANLGTNNVIFAWQF
jgi:hypothetical protein